MSVSVNLVGMAPGGGGSFPMAGTRPKVRKTLTVTSGSMAWAAPQNVYFINVMGCGGGGGGGCGGSDGGTIISTAGGGGGAEALEPATIQINPGSIYNITIGTGGLPGSSSNQNTMAGRSGGNTTFSGDVIYLYISGGMGGGGGADGSVAGGAPGSSSIASTFGFTKIAGGQGGSATPATATTGSSVQYTFGGNPIVNVGLLYTAAGGGASLYGTGSSALLTSTGSAGYGGGGAGGVSTAASGIGSGSRGGSGFFRIVWEE